MGLLAFLLLTNVPLMLYTGVFHQGGPLAATRFLRDSDLCNQAPPVAPNVDVLFLTPCHTDPGHSHLHCPARPLVLHHLWCASPEYGNNTASELATDPSGLTTRLVENLNPRFVVLYAHDVLRHRLA